MSLKECSSDLDLHKPASATCASSFSHIQATVLETAWDGAVCLVYCQGKCLGSQKSISQSPMDAMIDPCNPFYCFISGLGITGEGGKFKSSLLEQNDLL